jgi:NAD(P)-dependent dehydrogenase (short-subunit alcohol dehydrogenase family)
MKRFQLMQRVNIEGLYGAVQEALPHLKKSERGGRIVVVCPPIYSRFFRGKTAYALGKVGMSVLVKGLAVDFEREGMVGKGMGVVGIWPAVVSSFLFFEWLFPFSSFLCPLFLSISFLFCFLFLPSFLSLFIPSFLPFFHL